MNSEKNSKYVTEKNSKYVKYRMEKFIFLSIFLLGVFLRLYNLGRDSLWLDEYVSFQIAREPSLIEVYSSALLDNHPPLHYLLLHIITYFGESEFILRLPSAVFGILTIPVAYKLGEYYFGKNEGLISAFLLSISYFHIRYSQEARMYAQLLFFSALSLYFFSRAIKENQNKFWIAFIFASTLGVYSHYFALLLIPSYISFFGIMKLKVDNSNTLRFQSRKFLLSLIGIAILSLPLASGFYITILHKTAPGTIWGVRPSLEFIPMIFGSLSGGYLNLPFFIVFFAFGFISIWNKDRKKAIFLSTWIFIPILLSIGIAYLIFFQLRYLIFLLIAYLIVVSKGITSIFSKVILSENRAIKGMRKKRVESIKTRKIANIHFTKLLVILLIIAILIAANFSSLANYYLYPNRDDWKGVASYLNEHTQEGDVIISLLLSHNLPFQYYYNAQGRELIIPVNYTISELKSLTSMNKTTWYLIHKDTIIVDPNLEISNWISANAEPGFLSPYIRIYVHRVPKAELSS
ncbi:MAG: glycosyltransferase family 39 protein [Methanocellales archaeon]